MPRLLFLTLLLLLNISNFYLSRHFLSPLLPSELLSIEQFIATGMGEANAAGFMKYDILLVWLAFNFILVQMLFLTYRKTNPNEGLPLGWFVFSFSIPFIAADYSFDYKTQSFGEYIDARSRTLMHIDSYPNRYGRQLVASLKKGEAKDISSSLTKVTAPPLGKLPAFGTLSDSCTSQLIRLHTVTSKMKNPEITLACELLDKTLENALPAAMSEMRCEAGPSLKILYALDQGGVACPLTKVDLTHTEKVCHLLSSYEIPTLSTCRLLKMIPLEKLQTLKDTEGL